MLPSLVAALKDREDAVCLRAVHVIYWLGPRAQPVVPVLLDIFQNPIRNSYLRVEVARALGKISSGDGPTSKILRAGMADSVIGPEMRRILRENQTAGQETERVKNGATWHLNDVDNR